MGVTRLAGPYEDWSVSQSLRVDIGVSTHLGLVRGGNEDHFIVCVPPDREALRSKGRLLAVADGMGGHAAGARASNIATTELRAAFVSAPVETPTDPLLVEAFRSANRAVLEAGEADPTRRGMGTTLVAAVIAGLSLTVANIGDSRCYLHRRGQLHQVTTDHTVANEVMEEQRFYGGSGIDAVTLKASSLAHQLTRCVGLDPDGGLPDVFHERLERGDVVLLASDGLTGTVPDRCLAQILDGDGSVWETAHELVAEALRNGGPDNVTAVVAVIEPIVL